MANYIGPVVDVDVHNRPAFDKNLVQYLPKEWREYGEACLKAGISVTKPPTGMLTGFVDAAGRRPESYPGGGAAAGSSYELLCKLWLDQVNIFKGILTHDTGEYSLHRNAEFAAAVCRAANDWMVEEWLSIDDDRLVAGIVPPKATPELAVEEIRRLADHPKMCCVYITGSPLDVPMGHPIYHPVYAAAAEAGKNILVHPHYRGEVAGTPSTMTEMLSHNGLRAMQDISSFIVYGVFEKFPDLHVTFTEFGFTWLTPLLADLDRSWPALKLESRWVKKRPSDYVREHVKLATQPIEGEGPELEALLDAIEGAEDILCYSSDYPHFTMDDIGFVSRHLPRAWHRKVFCDNACEVFGWTPPESAPEKELVLGAA